jgi:CRP/FNR family cyclic AMP-dependent transcriptional regulator
MKTTTDLNAVLRKQRFFKHLGKEPLALLARSANEQSFPANALLFASGEAADRFFLLREGTVSVELPAGYKRKTQIETIDSGGLLGWSWLVPPYRWHFSARAVQPVSAYVFDAEAVRKRMEKDHEVGYEILKGFSHLIAHRMEEALPQILNFYA